MTDLKRLLLVEDSVIVQRITGKILEKTCIVDAVSSAPEALACLKKQKYDIVVADYILKEGCCIQMLRQFRNNADAKTLPIIVITSSLDELLLNKLLRLGVNEALMKPVTPERIKELVVRMLETPYVREIPANGHVDVECYHWEKDGRYFGFNPETQAVVEGDTKADVTAKMRTVLDNSKVGWIADGWISKYVVTT